MLSAENAYLDTHRIRLRKITISHQAEQELVAKTLEKRFFDAIWRYGAYLGQKHDRHQMGKGLESCDRRLSIALRSNCENT